MPSAFRLRSVCVLRDPRSRVAAVFRAAPTLEDGPEPVQYPGRTAFFAVHAAIGRSARQTR